MTDNINKEKGHFRKNWFFYTLLLIASGFAGYFGVSKEFALKRQANNFEAEKTMLLQEAQDAFQVNSNTNMELMMKAFVWAVRGEMIRGNQEQVDQYFKQLVKSEKVQEVTLVDKEGKILISSNKKNEGNNLAEDFAKSVLATEEMNVIDRSDKQIVAAPVMSLDSRIGTLVVVCKKDVFELDDKVDLTAD